MIYEDARQRIESLENRFATLLLDIQAKRSLLEICCDHDFSKRQIILLIERATREGLHVLQDVFGWPAVNADVQVYWSEARPIPAEPALLGSHKMGRDLAISACSADSAPQITVDVRLPLQVAEEFYQTKGAIDILRSHIRRLTPLHLNVAAKVGIHSWTGDQLKGRILGISTILTGVIRATDRTIEE